AGPPRARRRHELGGSRPGARRGAGGRGVISAAGSGAPAAGEALLELDHVTMSFGGLKAVSTLDLEVREHELVGLIGPNGAGKTTVFNLITGVYTPTSGAIRFRGRAIHG